MRGRIRADHGVAHALTACRASERLRWHGWEVVPTEGHGADPAYDAVMVWATASDVMDARPAGQPALVLGDSGCAGHLRLGEMPVDGGPGEDRRLARLVATLGLTLDDDAIADALARLAPLVPAAAIGGSGGVVVAAGVPADFAAALNSHAATDVWLSTGALAFCGSAPGLWQALAEGHEVLCLGTAPLAGLGLTHDARTVDDLPAALASLGGPRANRRDAVRRALATEILFNSVPADDGAALADMVDQSLRALLQPRRRSVSIVITSHNYVDFLPAAIASALDQIVAAEEVVVVDDGSTDGSADLVAATPGIVAVLQPNRGQAAAFDAGFRRTSGEIVVFLDADDRLLPDAVERIGSADLEGVSRLFFRLETIDRHGRPTGLYRPGTEGAPAATGHLAGALATHGIFPFVPTSGNAFPRQVLERLLPMREADWRICADLWLVLAAAALGEALELPEVLGQYRLHGSNAHFRELGTGLHARTGHLQRQRIAWRGLLREPPRGTPEPVARALRTGLRRCLLHNAAPGQSGLRARLSDALMPLGAALAALSGFAAERPEARLLASAGPACWPRLVAGEPLRLEVPSPAVAVLGHGWSRPDGRGARLSQSVGSLAFRLADVRGHWRARLSVELDGDGPLRGLGVDLNGTPIDSFDLHGAGEIDLKLPAELLPRWANLLAAVQDMNPPARGPRDQAACLTLRTAPGDTERLRLTGLGAAPLTTVRAHAPRLATGAFLPLAGPAPDPRARTCLGRGWGWSDARGFRLEGTGGCLSLALATGHDQALTLLWDDPTGTGRPADRVLVCVNDALVPAHPSSDGRLLTVELLQAAAGADGRVRVRIMPFADPRSGGWPEVRLRAVRLDRLTPTFPGDPARLVPHAAIDAATLAGAGAASGEVEGLLPSGQAARIVDDRFRLPLATLPDAGPVRLELAFQAPDPILAAFTLAGRRLEAVLCGENRVTLDVPPDAAGSAVLLGEIGDPARRCFLLSARLVLPSPADPGAVAKGRPSSWPAGGAEIGPDDLHRLCEDPADWHAPLEDALWLARNRATLVLPPLPPQTVALWVGLLPLAGAGQRVRVAIGGSSAETEGPGPQTLHLPLEAAQTGMRLMTLACNRLVAAQAVEAGDAGMLGGAILWVRTERRPPAARAKAAVPDRRLAAGGAERP